MATYDPLKLCKKVSDGYYEADPSVYYPETLTRIQECLKGERPVELMEPELINKPHLDQTHRAFMLQAEKFPEEAWTLAFMPFGKASENWLKRTYETITGQKKDSSQLRAEALAFAESWFKRALSVATGAPIRLHIVKHSDWKR